MLKRSKGGDRKCKKCGSKTRKGYCDACYNRSPAGRARYDRYHKSEKGKTRHSRSYYKRLAWSGDSRVAKREASPDARERARVRNKLAAWRFRQRWGHLNCNPVHRERWENIREGLWKEEEHPL